jgi:hypothetical protein
MLNQAPEPLSEMCVALTSSTMTSVRASRFTLVIPPLKASLLAQACTSGLAGTVIGSPNT